MDLVHAILQLCRDQGFPASLLGLMTDTLDAANDEASQLRLLQALRERPPLTQTKIRTTICSSVTSLYDSVDDRAELQAPPGTPLEILDVDTDMSQPPSFVRAVVAGYRLAWIATADLFRIEDKVYDVQLTACLTASWFPHYDPDDITAKMISLLGASFRPQRQVSGLTWQRLVNLDLRRLQSLESRVFTDEPATERWRYYLPQLQSVVIQVDLSLLPAFTSTLFGSVLLTPGTTPTP